MTIDSELGGDTGELFISSYPEAVVVDVDSEGLNIAASVLHLHHRYLHLYI